MCDVLVGVALALGPNINLPMQAEAIGPAWQAAQKAVALAPGATTREQAYIHALAMRYAVQPPEDRSTLDRTYADAMRDVSRADPDDEDAAVLFAEALMDVTPWDYWQPDGRPKGATPQILGALESVLARDPDHIGANHLYIHAVEAKHPTWGIAAASRLGNLVPGAGHLVHMPAHIWIRVGRYHDAIVANQRAIRADNRYIAQCRCNAREVYPLIYMLHNHHFLWVTAMLVGNRKIALQEASYLHTHTDPQMMRVKDLVSLQELWVTPYFTQVAFGLWDEILSSPEPDDDLIYPRAVWHYARTMALLRTGQSAAAQKELGALRDAANNTALEAIGFGSNSAASIVQIAAPVAAGERSAASGDFADAIAALRRAVAREDALGYMEPPDWPIPVRRNLGAILLEAGQAADAERVFREDLVRFPDNGPSLFGLEQSLQAQGKAEQAAAVHQRVIAAAKDAGGRISAVRS